MTRTAPRLPVTLLAGFLGSGKTTLLNRILRERHGERVAVVVNEFGDLAVDGRLLAGGPEELVELANGCLCCTVRADLCRTLVELDARRTRRLRPARFDRVLIEASGLASPGPAVQTLLADDAVAAGYEPEGVVTLAHAAHVVDQLERHPEAAEQIAYADLVLLNHADRASAEELERAEAAVRACNAAARVERCVRAGVPVPELLDLRAERAAVPRSALRRPAAGAPAHTSGVATVGLTAREPLDLHRLKLWLAFVRERRGQELMRAKGVLRCGGHDGAVVVQALYQWLEIGPGPGPAPEESRLVLIGRDLDRAELERGFAACRAS